MRAGSFGHAGIAALAGGAYLLTASAALAMTRFEGGVACLWFANAAMIAALVVSPRNRWPAICGACTIACATGTGIYGVGWAAAVPLSLANLMEGLIAASLLVRTQPRPDPAGPVEQLLTLIGALGVAAPLASATIGAAVVEAITGLSYRSNWWNWYAGHALGNLTFVPVGVFALSGAAGRWVSEATLAKRLEAAALLLTVLVVTLGVFSQSDRPLLFLPILPVILATFRVGRLGAASAVAIVAVVGGWYTVHGHGPVSLVPGGELARAQFFQFYLAATVLTALPVSAELRRRRALFERLRDSEARYRLLLEHSSDIVMSLKCDATIRYVSPSIERLGGVAPGALEGTSVFDLVAPAYRPQAEAAHREVLAEPDRTVVVELQTCSPQGECRWFETHSRGVRDEAGRVTGVVCVTRDVTERKAREGELSRAALTDPLTGLGNRRAFDRELDRLVDREPINGCVAVFDIDFFKRVNDRWGHDAGDRVLAAFAQVARGAVREGDLVARLGGEEFGVLLPGADATQAWAVCERIRNAAAQLRIPAEGGVVAITVSAGIAKLEPAVDSAALLKAADVALYRAKAEGRDRLRLAA